MNKIYTDGLTKGKCENPDTGVAIHYTILSKRAAAIAIRLSNRNRWGRYIIPYDRPVEIPGGLLLVGFQGETGRHIAVSSTPKGEMK